MHNDRRVLVSIPVRVEFADKTANIMSSTMEISRSASLNVATKPKSTRPSFKLKWKSFRARTYTRKKSEADDSYGGGGGADGDGCDGGDSRHRRPGSPTEEFFIMDSFSDNANPQDELTVKICKENIRQNLLDGLRQQRGNDTLLVEMENARGAGIELDPRAFETLNEAELNVAFLWAAFIGRVDYLETLYQLGADVAFTMQRESGCTALHLSAFSGCVSCISWLIEKGCDINATYETFTPLHYAVLGNSLDSVNFLINQPQVIVAETVLHAAVLANSVDCVKFFLDMNANVAVYDQCGMTPLHVAADRSFVQCLKIMLERQPVHVDVKTLRRQATALHLASENGHHACVRLLLEWGASLAACNYKGQTALHLAAKAQSYECAEELLRAGSDVNACDSDGRTPLHSAVCKPQLAFAIVKLLVGRKADVNVSDRYGYTPLHLAAYNELADCVDTLIMTGANVGARTNGGFSALNIINHKTPTSVEAIRKKLDKSLSVTEPDGRNNRELRLNLDFRYIKQNSTCGEIGFLQMLKKEGHRELLEHPLCIAFLHLKWEKVRAYYFVRLAFCTFFIVFLSLYVMTALAHDCYNAAEYMRRRCHLNETRTEATEEAISNCTHNSFAGQYLIHNQWLMRYIWYTLVGCDALELVRKLYSTPGFSSFRQYFESLSNVIEWVVMASVLAISCVFFGEIRPWQKQVGAFAVLAGWSILMIMIGQLPVFGTYIAMYTKVQREFIKLLMAYCCLLIGFTICFCVVFPSKAFSNPLVGFVKVLAMMTGELDVNSLLVEPVGPQRGDLTASAYVAFVLFLFFVTIVLINLLVGIAVHDIEGLHKTAGLSKLVRQTELIYFLELALFHGYLPNRIMKWLKGAIFMSPGGYRVVVSVRPCSLREKRLPKDVMEAALAIARAHKKYHWSSTFLCKRGSTGGGAAYCQDSRYKCKENTPMTAVTKAASQTAGAALADVTTTMTMATLLDELHRTQQALNTFRKKQMLQKLQELLDLIQKLLDSAAKRNGFLAATSFTTSNDKRSRFNFIHIP